MSDRDDSLRRDPGVYLTGPGIVSQVDQQRAEATDAVRTAQAVSVTWLDANGGGTHWAYVDDVGYGGEDAQAFVLYVLVRAWRDARVVVESDGELAIMLTAALSAGVGK